MLRRVVIATGLMLLSGYCVYRYSYIPFVCNRENARVLTLTQRALNERQYRAAAIARQNLNRLAWCREHLPGDVDGSMLAGANYQILERWDEAAREYQQALRSDRRPEIYYNLGYVLTRSGQRGEALTAYTNAALFAPVIIDEIEDAQLQDDVRRKIRERDHALRANRVSGR